MYELHAFNDIVFSEIMCCGIFISYQNLHNLFLIFLHVWWLLCCLKTTCLENFPQVLSLQGMWWGFGQILESWHRFGFGFDYNFWYQISNPVTSVKLPLLGTAKLVNNMKSVKKLASKVGDYFHTSPRLKEFVIFECVDQVCLPFELKYGGNLYV